MTAKLSDKIRRIARDRYVNPALQMGKVEFSISVRDLLNDLKEEGFPGGHTPQICSALQTAKFLRENGLEIEAIKGPPSKMSPTVVVRYRVTKSGQPSHRTDGKDEASTPAKEETPEERALRLTERIRGLLKDELAEYGGTEGFIRWVRGYDEEDSH